MSVCITYNFHIKSSLINKKMRVPEEASTLKQQSIEILNVGSLMLIGSQDICAISLCTLPDEDIAPGPCSLLGRL
jgi:hypothetical protein